MKTCTRCGKEKDETQFRKGRKCNKCLSELATARNKEMREKDPVAFAERTARYAKNYRAKPQKRRAMQLQRLRAKYGLSPEQLDQMLVGQDYRCAICLNPFGDTTPHVDHNHACCPGEQTCGSCVRGLLCASCNRGIGYFHDSTIKLESAAEYIRSYRG